MPATIFFICTDVSFFHNIADFLMVIFLSSALTDFLSSTERRPSCSSSFGRSTALPTKSFWKSIHHDVVVVVDVVVVAVAVDVVI